MLSIVRNESGGAFSSQDRSIYTVRCESPCYVYIERQEDLKGGKRRSDR
jgi:hypothetical protein